MELMKYVKKLKKEGVDFICENEKTRKLIAKDAMIKPVFVHSDDDADKIIKKLKKENTNVCIVITREKKFVGEISNEDLILLFLHQIKHEPLAKILNMGYKIKFQYKTAKELVNQHKSTVSLDTPINDVIESVYKEGFHYIPVLDKDNRVVGVVTPSSILNLLEHC